MTILGTTIVKRLQVIIKTNLWNTNLKLLSIKDKMPVGLTEVSLDFYG